MFGHCVACTTRRPWRNTPTCSGRSGPTSNHGLAGVLEKLEMPGASRIARISASVNFRPPLIQLLSSAEGRDLLQRPPLRTDRRPGDQGQLRLLPVTDRETLLRVTDDLVPPNGIVGTPDGSRLYIADQGAGRLWTYRPESDGTTLFITARRSLYRVEMLVTRQ